MEVRGIKFFDLDTEVADYIEQIADGKDVTSMSVAKYYFWIDLV